MKKGFTLAEVLITLGIIGVVAAITIPTIIQKTDKAQYLTKLKKAYAQGNEALKLMANDMGCPNDLKCTGLFNGDNEAVGSELVKYYKVVKNCGVAEEGCMSSAYSDYIDGSGGRTSMDDWGWYSFITADGMSIAIRSEGVNCGQNSSLSGIGPMSQYCGEMLVDLNGGDKVPNNAGKDIFDFQITNGKGAQLYPLNGSDDRANGSWKDGSGNPVTCDSDSDAYGWSCAARIMEEGWQINYYGGSSSGGEAPMDCSDGCGPDPRCPAC